MSRASIFVLAANAILIVGGCVKRRTGSVIVLFGDRVHVLDIRGNKSCDARRHVVLTRDKQLPTMHIPGVASDLPERFSR